MSDITKCKGIKCTACERCYRYTAVETYWQLWFTEQPGKDENCPKFWPNTQCTKKKIDHITDTNNL